MPNNVLDNSLAHGRSDRLLDPAFSAQVASNITGWGSNALTPRDTFLKILGQWETSIPLQSLWMVLFDIPKVIPRPDGPEDIDTMMKNWGEGLGHKISGNEQFTSNAASKYLITNKTMGERVGCAFSNAVNIPGETTEVNHIGFDQRGFLKDPIMGYRQPLQAFSTTFLETNLSFVEHIIRPWLILSSHMGFAARPESKGLLGGGKYGGLATDMTIVHFAKADVYGKMNIGQEFENKAGMIPRKIWVFKDCVPIKVDSQNMTYGIDNDLQTRNVEWQYRKYQVFFPEMNMMRMQLREFLKFFWQGPSKAIEAENHSTAAQYNTKWGISNRPSSQIIEDVHKKGARDPQQHALGGSHQTYFPGAQYLSDAAGKSANYSTHQGWYNAIKGINSSAGSADLGVPYGYGTKSWGSKGLPHNGTDGVNLVTALKGGPFPPAPPSGKAAAPKNTVTGRGNDPENKSPIKEATSPSAQDRRDGDAGTGTEVYDAHMYGLADPSTGEDWRTGMGEREIWGPRLGKQLNQEAEAKKVTEEDVKKDWGGWKIAKKNKVHNAIRKKGPIGKWGAKGVKTPGGGVSNMQNKKKAQKIKGSSGIFGLLGF